MTYLPHWPIPSTLGNRQIDFETVFERMSAVLEKLGNPHHQLPPTIHIAGTNGKGSTASILKAIYQQAGYQTHLYTSPHLHDCNERIILNGEKITDSFLFEVMEEARLATHDIPLSFMEGFTIGAILAFSKVKADILIMECGMGGRIDATNIIPTKIATVITPISYDHMEYLGTDIRRIALEKAMIMRPNTPLICASQPKQALEIIDTLARDQAIPTYYYDQDFEIGLDDKNGSFDLRFKDQHITDLPAPNLLGSHQYINAATAIATSLTLQNIFKIEQKNINRALKNITWPSRLENITQKFSLSNPQSDIYIDGAHNEAGAFAIARWLMEENSKIPKDNIIICGFSKNKCKAAFLEKFKNIAEIIAIRVDGEPYPEEVADIIKVGKTANLTITPASDLLEAIKSIDQKKAQRIIICGSLHLARDVAKFG